MAITMTHNIFYGWIIAGAGFVLSFVGIGARYSFGVFLKSIEAEFGMGRAATSSVFSIYMLLCVLMSVLGGWALDRHGPRKIGIIMGMFTGLSFFLTSRVHSPWQLFVTYSLLFSLGTGALYGMVNTTASRWFVKQRGVVVGITSSGGGVGSIVIAPFATYLISNFNWRTAFVVLGVMAWIIISLVSLLLKKDPRDMGLLPDGGKTGLSRKDVFKNTKDVQGVDFSLGQAFRMNQLWLLGLAWLTISLNLHMVFIHIVAYVVDKGISLMDGAFILSLMGFINIFGRLVVGKLSDTLGRKALGVACTIIQSATLLWLMWSHQLWMLYAFGIVFGFLWGGSSTVITTMVGDIFGTRNLGVIMGVITAGWALGAAVGPAIGGYIFDVSGDYFVAFGAGAVALILSAGFIALIKPVSDRNNRGGVYC